MKRKKFKSLAVFHITYLITAILMGIMLAYLWGDIPKTESNGNITLFYRTGPIKIYSFSIMPAISDDPNVILNVEKLSNVTYRLIMGRNYYRFDIFAISFVSIFIMLEFVTVILYNISGLFESIKRDEDEDMFEYTDDDSLAVRRIPTTYSPYELIALHKYTADMDFMLNDPAKTFIMTEMNNKERKPYDENEKVIVPSDDIDEAISCLVTEELKKEGRSRGKYYLIAKDILKNQMVTDNLVNSKPQLLKIERKYLNKFITFFQMKDKINYSYRGRDYSAENYTAGITVVASMTLGVILITLLCILDPILSTSAIEILMVLFALYAFSFMSRSMSINLTKEGKEQRKSLKKVLNFYYNNYKCYSGEKSETLAPRYNIELSKNEELFLKSNLINYRNDK